jgi:xanthosine utilization system XapX-like protein
VSVRLIRHSATVLMVALTVGLALPLTRDVTLSLIHRQADIRENGLIEVATFLFAALAGLIGFYLSLLLVRRPAERVYFLLFGLVMIFIAGEEVSWGQWIEWFETPEWFREHNSQGEMNLHNLGPLQGRSEIFRVAFCLVGVAGLRPPRRWREVLRVPSCLALPLVVALVFSTLDLLADILPFNSYLDSYLSRMSEAVELVIAFVALAYGVLHARCRWRLGRALRPL